MSTFNKPFASSSPTDHRSAIWVSTLLCLTFVALGVAARVWTRLRAFGSDDYVIVGAFVVALVEFCTVIGGLTHGLGRSTGELSSDSVASAGQVFLASEAIFVVTIYVIKHSVVCTVERLLAPDQKLQRMACWVFHGVLVVCLIASLLVVAVDCSAIDLLTRSRFDSCPSQTPRWIAIATIDSTLEVAVFIAFTIFISTLQLQPKLKITVTLLLAFRLGCIAFAALHAHHIAAFDTRSNTQDSGLAVVGSVVWQQLNLGYSLLSALLIALKSFLASFETNHGWGEHETFKATSAGQSGNARDASALSYGMKPLSKSGKKGSVLRSWGSRNDDSGEKLDRNRAGKTGYKANVEARGKEERDDGSVGSGRSGISQHPIIRYEQRFEVTSESKSGQEAQV
ncbi:uncharacterized protein LTR77_009255 [Saxophila tyrrhenica]|uniref:Rhodopsin domain-containing protein n=1 Tax=Saxophila tyrrhenica TaxID=1690608 RepID=A0AAV9P1Y8_9PEZI|nr:hypothetical protein LTR77_009255 [Saxophila tyrrhenica]